MRISRSVFGGSLFAAVLAGFLGGMSSCGEDVHQVSFTYGPNGEGLLGFTCRQPAETGPRIIDAALGSPISLVVDYGDLRGNNPGCRAPQILAYCAEAGCPTITGKRSCLSATVGADLGVIASDAAFRAALADRFESLDGDTITRSAPQRTVIVRMVATTTPCDQIAPPDGSIPPFTNALGCAFSSPVDLANARGNLFLGFDTPICDQAALLVCANLQ